MALLFELDQLTKLYGTVIGVNDISLSVGPGAYGLLGPNGSGKTTLLNLITGQLRPTLGGLRVLERSPWNDRELCRRIGLCPATDILLPRVSGLEWVTYLLRLQGRRPAEARRLAFESLGHVGMTEAMHRSIDTYSKGMRQRTKLAQAIAHEPELLILDEPFNGLDPVGRHEMTQFLRQWIRRGKSLLLASHILHEVEAVTSAFLLICGGRLLASGPADEIRNFLVDLPSEIRIRCDRPTELSHELLGRRLAEGIRLDDSLLVVSTRNPLRVYEELPALIVESGFEVNEVRSPDESLEVLFDTLLRMHRGETL